MSGQAADGGRAGAGRLLRVTAAFEGATGLAFLVLPSAPVRLLFSQPLDPGVAGLGLRIAGAALLSLALACWQVGAHRGSPAAPGLVRAMLVYNVLATGVLLYGRLGLAFSGFLLWPAIGAHLALALWCATAAASGSRDRRVTRGA